MKPSNFWGQPTPLGWIQGHIFQLFIVDIAVMLSCHVRLKNPALKVQGFKVRLEVASILKNKY